LLDKAGLTIQDLIIMQHAHCGALLVVELAIFRRPEEGAQECAGNSYGCDNKYEKSTHEGGVLMM
jgi:hypothetical protein